MPSNNIQDYELLDHFDIVPDSGTSNNKKQLKAKEVISPAAELNLSDVERKCGDKMIVKDPDSGDLSLKDVMPGARTKIDRAASSFIALTGSALDAYVGGTLFSISGSSAPFSPDLACYQKNLITTHLRLGSWGITQGVPGDVWLLLFNDVGADDHDVMLEPSLYLTNTSSQEQNHQDHVVTASDSEIIDRDHTHTTAYEIILNPTDRVTTYTPSPLNKVKTNGLRVKKIRQEILQG